MTTTTATLIVLVLLVAALVALLEHTDRRHRRTPAGSGARSAGLGLGSRRADRDLERITVETAQAGSQEPLARRVVMALAAAGTAAPGHRVIVQRSWAPTHWWRAHPQAHAQVQAHAMIQGPGRGRAA